MRARSSLRALLAATAIGVGLLAPAPAGAAEDGLLVVEGRGGTTTTVTIDSRPFVEPEVDLLGGGPYAGALVEPVETPGRRLLAVQVRAFGDETRDERFATGLGELPPGRYRVTLLGQGPVRVAWSLREQDAGIRIVPTTRIPVTFLGRAEQQAVGYSETKVDLPGAAPAGRRVLQLLLRDGTRAQDSRMCVTTGTECPGNPAPFCPPPPVPCGDPRTPEPDLSTGGASLTARLVGAAPVPRRLLWTAEGYRTDAGRLRAAALLF